jgi:hypothetical protein
MGGYKKKFTLFGAATNDSISATASVAMVCGDPISQSLHVLGILITFTIRQHM